MPTQPSIFLITGVPGSGKTSVATALMQRFPFGVHIPIDDLREWVVSGIAQPVPIWTEETERQFRLARQAAVQIALNYVQAGFAVAIDDVIVPADAKIFSDSALSVYPFHKILLQPQLDVALERNALRTKKNFDISILEDTIQHLYQWFLTQRFTEVGWISLDNTHLTVEQTVDIILAEVPS